MKRAVCVVLVVLMTVALCVFPASAAEKVTLTYDLMYDGKTFTQEVKKGEAPVQAYFERDGYETYLCYADASFSRQFDFSESLSTDKTVYVRWLTEDELVYADIYLYPDSEYPTASGTLVRGEVAGQYEEPGREGEFFAGWYLDKSFTVPYNPTAVIYESFALYACFVDSQDKVTGYNIFESPDAEEPLVGGFIKRGGQMFLPASPEMDEDEMLEGWFRNRELTNEIDFSQPVTDQSIYLFPSVLSEQDVYTVSLYLDAKDAEPVGCGTVKKGKPIPKPESPSREGEIVTGWYTDRALTQEADFTSPNENDVSLFPRWEKYHSHHIVEVPGKAATATTDGCKKYFQCTECKKWYYPVYSALLEIEDHDEMLIPATGPFFRGDANGDGDVNINDVTAIQRFIAEMETEQFCREAANAEGDGNIDISDATAIQCYLAGFDDPYHIGEKVSGNAGSQHDMDNLPIIFE